MDEETKAAAIAFQRYTQAENCREKMRMIVEQLEDIDCDIGQSAFGSGFIEGFALALRVCKGSAHGHTDIEPGVN